MAILEYFIGYLKVFFYKPGIETPYTDSMLNQIIDIKNMLLEVRDELTYDKEILIKELRKKDAIINAMIENLPDMLWFKDVNGKYMYANKSIREGLLFDDNPIGKTDMELALQAKKRFGDENHEFGESCGNSDIKVLEEKYVNKRFVESGKIKGVMTHLEVNKSIIILDDEIIGVVGSARDITEYREELLAKGGDIDVFAKNEFLSKDK